ncbi:MAG: phosphodiester glycosidase family protein [Gammaproteobacteria bacterium]
MTGLYRIIGCLCLLWLSPLLADTTHWQKLSPGLDYAVIPLLKNTSHGKLHAFRIDPNRYTFQVLQAKDYYLNTATAYTLGKQNNALITINAGFFNPADKPLGLRLSEGNVLNPLKNISWWGIFYTEREYPRIVSRRTFHKNPQMNFAIQAGPRLVINSHIPPLKEDYAERTVLGITTDNRIIVAVTDNAPVTTEQMAQLLLASSEKGGLNCKDALNLDGGSSSQLYAHIKNFYLYVPGFARVPDVIIVKAKKTGH